MFLGAEGFFSVSVAVEVPEILIMYAGEINMQLITSNDGEDFFFGLLV